MLLHNEIERYFVMSAAKGRPSAWKERKILWDLVNYFGVMDAYKIDNPMMTKFFHESLDCYTRY